MLACLRPGSACGEQLSKKQTFTPPRQIDRGQDDLASADPVLPSRLPFVPYGGTGYGHAWRPCRSGTTWLLCSTDRSILATAFSTAAGGQPLFTSSPSGNYDATQGDVQVTSSLSAFSPDSVPRVLINGGLDR